MTQPQNQNEVLTPKRIQEKADILETNLFKSISTQTDLSRFHIKINRAHFPDAVISKALVQLMPRFNVKPREFLLGLRDLLLKEIAPDKQEKFEKELGNDDVEELLFDDSNTLTRRFEAVVSRKELEIIVKGVPEVKTIHGEIAKAYFNHEFSPGKLSKDGIINFKEINKYPIANAGDNLLYISHEIPGKIGLSFDGKVIPVEEAKPFAIQIGPGVKEIGAPAEEGKPKGYFLQALATGVILIDRNEHQVIKGIDISENVEIKKLDYSTGNIGTQYTCPVQMKIGEICNGFKIRVNGKVEVQVVDGGEIITNNEAVITQAQADSKITALKDITVDGATRSQLVSEQGSITVHRELIDSNLSGPRIFFERNKGLFTNNHIETENLTLTGLYFSGENIIWFARKLFEEKKALVKARENQQIEKSKFSSTEKLLMGQLQIELKRLAKLTLADPDLVKHVKPVILATHAMNYEVIYREMAQIEKRNHTKVVTNVRKLFEALEKIPKSIQACELNETETTKQIDALDQRMSCMKLSIEGFLRRAGAIKIFCGMPDDSGLGEPDFILDSDLSENKYVKLTGTYSPKNGFEFVR